MSVAIAIPRAVYVLLSARRQNEIAGAALEAEQRLAEREQIAESWGQRLQWVEWSLDQHVADCLCCRSHACPTLRQLRRERNRLEQRYRRSLRQLRGCR